MLLLHDAAFDDVLGQWCHASICYAFVQVINSLIRTAFSEAKDN